MLYFYIDNETKFIVSSIHNSYGSLKKDKAVFDHGKVTLVETDSSYFITHQQYIENPNYIKEKDSPSVFWKWIG